MNKIQISSDEARKIILNAQLLGDGTGIANGKTGVEQTIEKLGYIQIDTISVIKRTHHHTLWTRRNYYKNEMLHELQAKDRAVFEYWGHAMSYLPMSDYRYYLPRMKNFENPTSKWAKYQFERSKHLIQPVLERIKNDGPLSSKNFTSSKKNEKRTWWDWKPAKSALEILFWRGDLMVTERKNFQKVYDLRDRVLPENIDTTIPSTDEIGKFIVRRALSSFGIASEKQIQKHLQPSTERDADLQFASRQVIQKSLNDLLDSKEIMQIYLEKDQNNAYYALSDSITKFNTYKQSPSQLFFLSPFDNLIIQRERTKTFFDFDYSTECYVPANKRKYGYYVLPILWGENFIGRLDPKADRKNKILIINNLVFEPAFKSFDEFLPLFVDKLMMLARFNACEYVEFDKVSPDRIKIKLESLFKSTINAD